MSLWAALAERWGPLPAGVWIAGAAVGLYFYARRAVKANAPVQVYAGAPGLTAPLPKPCPYQVTPNRALGLMGPPGLPAPMSPWTSLQGGIMRTPTWREEEAS